MTRGRVFSGCRAIALAFGICLFLCAAAARVASADVVDRIVAVVNDDIILLSDLKERLRPYIEKLEAMGYPPEQEQQMLEKMKKDFLDRLIEERLTDQQVKSKGISVSENEVDMAIERLKQMQSLTDEALGKGLESEGLTMEQYRKQLQEQLLRSKLLDYEVKSKIVVTEEDIQKYYEKNIEEFGGEKKYHLRNIVMRVPPFADEDEKLAVRRRMEAVYQKLQQGADFAEMSRRYSESSLAADGGDLGFFKLKEMAPEFRRVLAEKDAGSFTPILDTSQGYQIFYVEEIVTTTPKALEEVRAEIQSRLYQQRVDEGFDAWLEDLRSRSYVKVIQ